MNTKSKNTKSAAVKPVMGAAAGLAVPEPRFIYVIGPVWSGKSWVAGGLAQYNKQQGNLAMLVDGWVTQKMVERGIQSARRGSYWKGVTNPWPVDFIIVTLLDESFLAALPKAWRVIRVGME